MVDSLQPETPYCWWCGADLRPEGAVQVMTVPFGSADEYCASCGAYNPWRAK